MLNTMMENENKFFASISILFLIPFIIKLIAQIKILFFPKLKVYVWNIQIIDTNIVIKMYVKIPSLLSSILDRSMTYAKPMNIYMGVGVTAFPITCHVQENGKANVTI